MFAYTSRFDSETYFTILGIINIFCCLYVYPLRLYLPIKNQICMYNQRNYSSLVKQRRKQRFNTKSSKYFTNIYIHQNIDYY